MASETIYINNLEIPNTTFIEISNEDGAVFDQGGFDGIVGLSFPDINDGLPTFFDFMYETQ